MISPPPTTNPPGCTRQTWERAFPEFEWGEAITQCGVHVIYEGNFLAEGTRCLMLPIGAEWFPRAEDLEQFARGMAFLQTVEHAGLLKLLGVGRRNGMACVVYEHFQGAPLTKYFRQRNKAHFSVNVIACVAEGLQSAHERGVAHGDVNPAWILINEIGAVKLAALGISRLLSPTNASFYESTLGRPPALRAYLAPEQLENEIPTSERTDIYAMGAIAYHLITGSPMGGFIVLPSSRREVGSFTDDVVFKATLKDPAARQESAAIFARDIRRIGGGVENSHWAKKEEQARRLSEQRARRVRRRWLTSITALLIAGGLGAFYFYQSAGRNAAAASTKGGERSQPSELRQFLNENQREQARALLAHLVQKLAGQAPGQFSMDELEEISQAAVELGEEESMLRLANSILQRLPAGTPDKERTRLLVTLLGEACQGHRKAVAAAARKRELGDKPGARHELARADAFLPGNPVNLAEKELLDYDPLPSLKAALEKVVLPGGGTLQYGLREDGLQIHLDLANNATLEDVSFLAGHPITHLDLSRTAVRNLMDIASLPLHVLHLDHTSVRDLRPLRAGTLRELTCEGCEIQQLGLIEHSVFLTSYRIGLPRKQIKIKTAYVRRGSAWTNHLGMRFAPMRGSKHVLFSDWETRVADFRSYMQATKLEIPPGMVTTDGKGGWATAPHTWDDPPDLQGEEHPVVGVSFTDARGFCQWLTTSSIESGIIPSKARFRLPTSREWTQATGLVEKEKKTIYPWGDDWPAPALAGNYPTQPLDGFAGEISDSFGYTSPVGCFRNASRHRDMGGNVREWCTDESGEKPILRDASCLADTRSFGEPKESLRLEAESSAPADLRDATVGFRVVLDFGD